jgi:hypothetical protein
MGLSGATNACTRADEVELQRLIHNIALFRILSRELEVPSNRVRDPAWTQFCELADEFDALDARIAQLPTAVQLTLTIFQLVHMVEGITSSLRHHTYHAHDTYRRTIGSRQL